MIEQLKAYQAWRRGEDTRKLSETDLTPTVIGEAIDWAINALKLKTADRDKLQDELIDMMNQRDALAAQVEVLAKAIKAIENDCIECSYDDETGYFVGSDSISEACDLVHYETPAVCLAQVKADAGRAGWLACWSWVSSDTDLNLEQKTFEDFANEYAERIRQEVE
jgi:hypothetical protein